MANKSLLLKNVKKFHETTNNSINYVDIDYDIKRPPEDPWTTHTRSMIPRNNYAILNGYRLWLQSKRYDYVRAPTFGGLFENNLNDRVTLSPANEETVKAIIIEETGNKWPSITIIACEVKAIMANREWRIKIIAQDKETKLVLQDDEIAVKIDDHLMDD